MFNKKAKRPTAAEKARIARLKEMPCIACMMAGMKWYQPFPTEAHHLLSGNKRRGHAYTIPLDEWHHRGSLKGKLTQEQMEKWWGPSLALTSKKFRERFGTDDELLAKTNELLERHHA